MSFPCVLAFRDDKSSCFIERNAATGYLMASLPSLEQPSTLLKAPSDGARDIVPSNALAELNFEGTFATKATTSLPTPANRQQLLTFFRDHRHLFLKGGDNPTTQIPPTWELCEQWQMQSKNVPSITNPPTSPQDAVIVTVKSTVPIIPGLAIHAVSYLGCQLELNPKTLLPYYEFTLLREEYVPHGIRPMIWMFNSLTGGANSNPHANANTKNNSRQTYGLCRVSMEPALEDHTKMAMHYFGFCKVSCRIPRRLLSILPVTPAKAQERVGAAIVQQLERECLQSIQKVQAVLERWLADSHSPASL